MKKQLLLASCTAVLLALGATKSNAQLLNQPFTFPNPNGAPRINFTPNVGQIIDDSGQQRPEVLYKTSFGNADLYVKADGVISYVFAETHPKTLATDPSTPDNLFRADLSFIGTSPNLKIIPQLAIATKTNYFIGNNGATNINVYQQITYSNLYDNIDFVIANIGGQPAYQFILRNGANLNDIKFTFGSVINTSLTSDGITASTPLGNIFLPVPSATQSVLGGGTTGSAQYVQTGSVFGIAVGNIGGAITGINIQCILCGILGGGGGQVANVNKWSTFYGDNVSSTTSDLSNDLTVDNLGNEYVVGTTASAKFPTKNATQTTCNGSYDAFLVKFNSNNILQFATYFGGKGTDYAASVAVKGGDVYIAGHTEDYSNNFPTINLAGAYNQSNDKYTLITGFISRFTANGITAGSPTWSTFFGDASAGGGGNTWVTSINIDPSGNVYICGGTDYALGFPYKNRSGAFNQMHIQGEYFGYVARFNASTLNLDWSTALSAGGKDNLIYSNSDMALSMAFDNTGNLFLLGATNHDLGLIGPAGSYQQALSQSTQNNTYFVPTDGYIMRFNTAGALTWSTCLGGTGNEYFFFQDINNKTGYHHLIATNSAGNVYVVGSTSSKDFPTQKTTEPYIGQTHNPSPIRTYSGGSNDGFITEFSNTGTMIWSNYIGGSSDDVINGIAIDKLNADIVYLTGYTNSTDFPTLKLSSSLGSQYNQPTLAGNYDGLLMEFNKYAENGWSTYFGGEGNDYGASIGVYDNVIRFFGTTTSKTTFPLQKYVTPSSYYQNTNGGTNCYTGEILRCVGCRVEGLADLPSKQDLQAKIYPNPTNGIITIDLQNFANKNIQLQLYNSLGQQVYSSSWNINNDDENIRQLNTNNYPKGIYFIKLDAGDGNSLSQKIVVQ